ncbi:endonuclease V [Rhizocola hellebori]|uniref:Endonuclease V n=1 Tax=Rhizocola hellebori TaxID=1392758 RepID=A0A8J3QHT5_9ACTN|nr:deoxyribonuclease V [Rhizocola hellebori]GIH09546.1 endonuclease V [Rhizocola hellebori]
MRDEAEAVAVQLRLRERVVTDAPLGRAPRLVAGVDVAYAEGSDLVAGAVVVLELDTLAVVETVTAIGVAGFPYVPGLLAFREIPVLEEALSKLTVTPDLLVCDGYGIAHPRRFGLASHLGVVTGIAAFGVGKTAFIGTHGQVGADRGSWAPLVDGDEIVGRVLRTQKNVKPVFVSPGHLIDVEGSAEITLRLSPKYRLPETTRHADSACRAALKAVTG